MTVPYIYKLEAQAIKQPNVKLLVDADIEACIQAYYNTIALLPYIPFYFRKRKKIRKEMKRKISMNRSLLNYNIKYKIDTQIYTKYDPYML